MLKITYKEYLSIALILAVIGVLGVLFQKPWQVGASVEVGSQYQSTTTPQVADRTNLCPAISGNGRASSTTGILGSVNVLLTGQGSLTIYDATTTNAALRAEQATSSLIVADFPASPTAGSYHFDVEFKRGLLVDYTTTGTGVASTTISYRCEG